MNIMKKLVNILNEHFFLMWLFKTSAFLHFSGERVGYNNMIYSESEIERIARVAGKIDLHDFDFYHLSIIFF